jgi:16S rRNA (cytidine1402-2'-O)-methyltransferase
MVEKAQNFVTSGSLYIVATPIGNLEDLTFRALRILGEVDTIACEDTRQTLKLLNKYNIKKALVSYYQPRENQKIPVILNILKQGKNVALVSDSGTPGISDPGFRLIREALKAGIRVVPVPGPTALAAGLSASGLPTHRFLFLGFPPPKKTAQKKLLSSLHEEPATLILYVPSRKIIDFLRLALETLGNRRVVIAREITKVFEEFIRGSISEILSIFEKRYMKGEITLFIQGKD